MLQLDDKDMKKLGYQIIDQLVEHFSQLRNKSVYNSSSPEYLQRELHESIPHDETNYQEIMEKLNQSVFSHISYSNHPRFFAFVPGSSNYIGVMADLLASGYNAFTGTWHSASGAAQIEKTTIDWFRQIFGMPVSAGGLFLSGGSIGNLTALILAKNIKLNNEIKDATIYYSDQTHSSIYRALQILGFRDEQIRQIKSNYQFEIDLDHLIQTIQEDKKNDLNPFCIVGNAGSTNTGAIDPIDDLIQLARKDELWLHVDGAFGAASILDERLQEKFKSIGQVDSLVFDPHKWWFQPYGIGGLLVKDATQLKRTFHVLPEYLKDIEAKGEEINYADYGPELTRPFRALKMWFSLKVFGLHAFKQAVGHGIDLARYSEQLVHHMPQWEIISPAYTCVINFRYVLKGATEEVVNQMNYQISKHMIESGWSMITTTTLCNKVCLRLCLTNPHVTKNDIDITMRKLNEIAKSISS